MTKSEIDKAACLVLNGEVKSYVGFTDKINSKMYDYIVAVDGGSNHLYKVGIIPDLIVGDLDSISENAKEFFIKNNVEFVEFPTQKNETDSELAILSAIEFGCNKIDIYAALGGRIDHELANINLLYYILKKDCFARIVSDIEEIYIVENTDIIVRGKKGDNISIIPLLGDVSGVSLENLEYPLDNFYFEFASPRGISNVMICESCRVSVKKGCLLVIKTSNSLN